MSPWLLVWYLIAAVTTVAVLVFVIALVRQALLVGRTARRFQEEAQPLVDDREPGGREGAPVARLR